MAALPPITQLAGNHWTVFEGYWSQLDLQGSGKLEAGAAAAFLKKSQLREPILHKIWNMSDPTGNGYLDKQGLFMALRLISVCQAGKEPLVANMALSDPPPKLVGVETSPSSLSKESDKAQYEKMFQGLQPVKGLLGGDKARPFMLSSKLPMDTLGKIWALSDIDKDGSLDLDEFCVAMKLIAMAKGGEVLPAVLPASLIPSSKSVKGVAPVVPSSSSSASSSTASSGSSVLLPTVASTSLSTTSTSSPSRSHSSSPLPTKKGVPVGGVATPLADVEWVVSKELQTKYERYFQGIDTDHDGYVSGDQARSLFMASNLQQNVLAHIWNLCDMEKNGRLNAEQFALAMYLIAEKVRKKDIPDGLTQAMIPPSLRGKVKPAAAMTSTAATPSSTSVSVGSADSTWGGSTFSSVSSVSSTSITWATPSSSSTSASTAAAGVGTEVSGFGSDFSAIQELDSITHEIDSIRKEKADLADDIKAKQELIQQRKVELEDFQENVDQATKQRETLEREREEARTQLEHLNTEKAKFEGQIAELRQNCDDEREEIERLKLQLSEQETSNKSRSEELDKLKTQFEQLKREEQEYKQKVERGKSELEKLQKANTNLQTDITQVRQRIENLKEEQQSLNTALSLYPPSASSSSGPASSAGVVNINDVGKLSAELHVPHVSEHDAISARATAGSSSPVSSLSGFSTNSHLDEVAEEGGGAGGTKEDKRPDPFASTSSTTSTRDPFAAFSLPASEDGFAGRAFSGGSSSKSSDLAAFDPFGTGGGAAGANFDPFKSSAHTTSGPTPATGEDLFRSNDPFSSASSARVSNSSSNNSLPHANVTVDPFSGQDPFNADPFASATSTSSASTTAANKDTVTQPSSLWGSSSPFDVDPFGQQNINTPTDPFSGSDPFGGDDPFKSAGGGSGQAGGSNPFGGFGAVWTQDGADKKQS